MEDRYAFRHVHAVIVPRLSVILAATTVVIFVGCSNSNELSSREDAARFISAVARGDNSTHWRLAAHASSQAMRAWAERSTIQDLGLRLRHIKAVWACEFAEGSAVLHRFGRFTAGDRLAVTLIARGKGATSVEISPLLRDVLELAGSDLAQLTSAACG